MRTFSRFLAKYKGYVLFAISLMLIELAVEVAQPFMMSKVIDEGIIAGQTNSIFVWGGLLLGTTVLAFGVGILSSFYSAYASQNFGFDLRQKLYDSIQKMSTNTFGKFQEASLLTRIGNDVNQVQNAVFMGMRIMLRAPLLVICSLIMALALNVQLALYLVIAFPILAVFLGWLMVRNNRLFRRVQQMLDQVNKVMQQSLMSVRLVRVFGRMSHENSQFQHKNNELRSRTVATMVLAELSSPVVLLLINGCILLMLWAARDLLNNGSNVSVGEIVAIVNYAMRITGALSMIAMIVNTVARASASMQRVDEVFETADQEQDHAEQPEEELHIEGDICFSGVGFTYPESNMDTLSDISFHVKAGSMMAIMGATGSGKSSLLQLIPRMYNADVGVITIDHKPVESYPLHQLRMNIGYVPQEIMLFTGTVADNIRWGKLEATMDEVIEAAKLAQIHEAIMDLPQGYETMIGQKGVNLSGGQKQRVSIARALVRKPSILLLDDCTSALDAETERRLLDAIGQLQCTVLLVTQKMSTTVRADSILLIDEGRVIKQGSHDELMVHASLYRKIVQSQWGKEREAQWMSNKQRELTAP
ncbi:ABC transporter ATP-binding protein [Paenibacillus septentrionalis]|uniref:ABC transporter ATP-binding protein n=1 Tax=Paenibacillus septentrionalis TaxID=429342 RepID=A0ABW1VB10_9BACL